MHFAENLFDRVGLQNRWAYFDAHESGWIGPCGRRANDFIGNADLVLNLGGINTLRAGLKNIPVRVLIDTDPVFNQVKHLTDPLAKSAAQEHNRFFSFAENIVCNQTRIPCDGLPWLATRQPVVLDMWEVTPPPASGLFTTVMQWDSYASVDFEGIRYGMKSDSFGPYMSMPGRVGPIFELSIGSPKAPRHDLLGSGWKLRNPLECARDPWAYQAYIRGSKGEFTVAKHGYVVTRCGWFSERSAAYLASGRPVVTQETGFSDWMETGCGVIPFQTPEQAIAAVRDVERNYEKHCRNARAIAEAYFDSSIVLSSLIEQSIQLSQLPATAVQVTETLP
jgi:hypothetical protein